MHNKSLYQIAGATGKLNRYAHQMITEKDIRTLKIHETRMGIIAHWALLIAPLFFIVMAILNLWLASRIASNDGLDLFQLFQNWADGMDAGIQYSETYLRAMQRLTNAMLQIGCAIPFFGFAYAMKKRRKLDARIVATLKDAGVIKE